MGMPIIFRNEFVRVRHELVTEVEAYAVREVPVKAQADGKVLIVDRALFVVEGADFVSVSRIGLLPFSLIEALFERS